MNSGKTTTAANMIRGLSLAGLSVNAGKVTGTGAGGDIWFYKDAGAKKVLDFLDAGYPSTYLLSPAKVKHNFLTLLGHLSGADTDVIVIEIADGLHQAETAHLIASKTFKHHVDGVIFSAADSLGGAYGVERLRAMNVNTLAVSGLVTRSPLAMRELQDAIELPVLGSKVLGSPTVEVYMREWLSRLTTLRAFEGGRR
jgi:molybdopterin-guanine dinucleotide biosynthesis protein